jgi:hypothetical protein
MRFLINMGGHPSVLLDPDGGLLRALAITRADSPMPWLIAATLVLFNCASCFRDFCILVDVTLGSRTPG